MLCLFQYTLLSDVSYRSSPSACVPHFALYLLHFKKFERLRVHFYCPLLQLPIQQLAIPDCTIFPFLI